MSEVSLRLPADLVEALDNLAAVLERPRGWVMERALRHYLEEGEGAQIAEDTESIAELDRGESLPFEDSIRKVRKIIADAEAKHARVK